METGIDRASWLKGFDRGQETERKHLQTCITRIATEIPAYVVPVAIMTFFSLLIHTDANNAMWLVLDTYTEK